ncbi:trypsin-like serine protease [Linderina pennispora]|uniref:Trypsin-like serine protease n=1 Tax=Linderina pennispora TaxID=61395 RepID=A0A1Y1W4G1_9FUNG|nr:trypsin-like serine protease [Linderina pennispora]ORX68054.1 trypsin-like serine protease [Linderina pennispora]
MKIFSFLGTLLCASSALAGVSTLAGTSPNNQGIITRQTPNRRTVRVVRRDASLPVMHERIIGGTKAPAGKYTFAVRLTIIRGTETFLCGGTLIAADTVVTAAHCMVDEDTNTIAEPEQVYKQDRPVSITVHPKYNPKLVTNDIAIIQIKPVDAELDGDGRFRCTPGDIPVDMTMTTMGWGKTSNNATSLAKTLMAVDVKVGQPRTCAQANPTYKSASGPEVCTVNALTPGKDSCQGDSGSPSVIEKGGQLYFVALTSVGTDLANSGSSDCALSDGLAFYTHVNYFMSFITSVTGASASTYTNGNSTKDLSGCMLAMLVSVLIL